jgi:hypothetical protein
MVLPSHILLTEGPLPAAPDGTAEKGWGPALEILGDPKKAAGAATAVSMVILALSQFLTDRAHEPKLLVLREITETVAPDGAVTRRRVERPVLIEPGPQLEVELKALFEQGKDLVIELRFED